MGMGGLAVLLVIRSRVQREEHLAVPAATAQTEPATGAIG